MHNLDLEELIVSSVEEAKKRSNMKAEIVNEGEYVAGIFRGTTDYPRRQFCTEALVLEKSDRSYVTFPLNDWIKQQLSVQNAIIGRSLITIFNNGIVETAGGNSYHNLTVVVTALA